MEKTIRIAIQTKGGFKFGYERTVRKEEKIEPLKLKQIFPEEDTEGKEVDIYA
jgi:hypothetical protein